MNSTELIIDQPARLALEQPSIEDFAQEFLAGRKPTTYRAYRQSLQDFATFAGAGTINCVMAILLRNGQGHATAIAMRYKANLIERKMSANTINSRISAIRAAIQFAKDCGVVSWTISVKNVKAGRYRDTRGPGERDVNALIARLRSSSRPKDIRNLVIVRLLHDLGLRRGEVVQLDVGSVDLVAGTVTVVGKGDTDATILTLPTPTREALQAWLECRGSEPGPLFTNFDRAGKGNRLTGRSIARIVGKLGREIGIGVRPHGLRHTAITSALDKTGGDYRRVQRFSRHADLRTVMLYDDNREDLAGEVAKLVAAS